jgi:hypothetical protein
LSAATHYGAFGINAPILNLANYHHILSVMVPFVITFPSKTLSQVAFFGGFLFPQTQNENRQLCLTKPHCCGRLLAHYLKPFQQSSCSKPGQIIASSEPFLGYLPVWHICANLEQG